MLSGFTVDLRELLDAATENTSHRAPSKSRFSRWLDRHPEIEGWLIVFITIGACMLFLLAFLGIYEAYQFISAMQDTPWAGFTTEQSYEYDNFFSNR